MAEEEKMKGKVTPLADLISVQDVERAIHHLKEAVDSHTQQLQQLQRYLDDNVALTNLLRTLPHSLRYNVMVPFGGVAFFPGNLIHTNELLVLVGEGYYSERSTKQTSDILERRSQYLELRIASVKAQITDIQAEIEFASNTAAEAAEGVVEIREEYDERASQSSNIKDGKLETLSTQMREVKDVEHERIMARLAEIEMAEEAAAAEGKDDKKDMEKDDWGLATSTNSDNVSYKDEDGDEHMIEDLEHEMAKMEQYDLGHTEEGDESVYYEEDAMAVDESDRQLLTSTGDFNNRDFPKKVQQQSRRLESSMEVGVKSIAAPPVIRSPADLLEFEQNRRKQFEEERGVGQKFLGEQTPSEVLEKNPLQFATSIGKRVSFAQDTEIPTLAESPPGQKAFSGVVIERSDAIVPSESIDSISTPAKKPSRFRMRQGT